MITAQKQNKQTKNNATKEECTSHSRLQEFGKSDTKEQRDAAAPCLASAAGSFSW